ncbi:MAG: hypothetical protein GY820_02025 [Gammaproteobacteria bacterium]|nr:hypothetical protein [Gammaproteobacteria bacterium]
MNSHKFASFKQRAKEAWIKMERWRLAYRSDHKSISLKANYLKWGTVLSGVLTGASSLTFLGADPAKYITGISGFITGVLTVVDKAFQWEASSNEAWRNSKLLEDLQSELYQYVWTVSANNPIENPESFLAKISNKISSYTSLPCSDPDYFQDEATQGYERLNFEKMKLAEYSVPDDADDDDILPEDTEGVTEIQPDVDGGAI